LSDRRQGEALVGATIWLVHDQADVHPEVPAAEALVVEGFRRARKGRGPVYLVRLPNGSIYPLEPQFVALVPPDEQRRLDAEGGPL
jgi:hypothetical protein